MSFVWSRVETVTNHSEDGEVLDHELHSELNGVQLQQIDDRLLGQLALGLVGDQLIGAEDVFDVIPGAEADPLGQIRLVVRKSLLANKTALHRHFA